MAKWCSCTELPTMPAPLPDLPPQPPPEPELEDCCRSGCSPCVFELYQDALDRYQAELAAWQARQPPAIVKR
jgi:hypothetical protein